ncbi:PAS domain S-box protein [Methylobacterium tarhaniae]|uniref:PAS domain S-box protein n=1 Tax=Methylobacterium tarhaniae TaxID=1187852 RepID=UPI0012EECA48|nr:PAS domain S-box protein [Methylobacterium tarhaniae]
MAERIRTFDWAATPLGSIATWSDRLKLMVEQVLACPLVSTLSCGRDGILVYNDAAAALYGDHHPAALGRPLQQTFPEGWATVAPFYERAFAGETVQVAGQPLDTRGEGEATEIFDALLMPVREADGGVAYVHMTGVELGERARSAALLRASEARYRHIFNAIDEGFCTIEVLFDDAGDPVDYRFLSVNAAFEQQTGLTDAVGKTIKALAPDLEAHWFETYGRIARTGQPERFEDRAEALGRWYDVYAFRIGPPEQRQVGVLFKDILARKRAEERVHESEERFRAFVTASSDVIYRMSPDWSEMRQLDGRGFLADTASLGAEWLKAYIHPADRSQVTAAIQDAIRSKTMFELEHRVRRTDGSLGWKLSRAVPLLDGAGDIREWLGTASDVTARKDAEEALRHSEARFRAFADTAPALIWRNDEKGENLFINAHFLDFTGEPADAIRGAGWHRLIHPDDVEDYVAGYLAAVHERRAWRDRTRLRRYDGQWRWFENFARPLFDDDGSYLGHVGVSADITASVAAEMVLRESETRQAFLLKFSDTLRAEPDADAIAKSALTMLLDHLRLDRCYITYYRPADDEADFPYQVGNDTVPPLPAKVRLSDFPDAYEQVLDKTFVIEDDFERRGLSEAERASSRALGMRAMVASTVRRGEKSPLCSMAAVSSRPRRWSPGEIALVEEAAERTWAAMERSRIEASLRRSEERFRALVTAGATMLYRMSPDWRQMYELSGRSVLADTVESAEHWAEMYLLPEDRPVIFAAIDEAIRTTSLFELEHRVRLANGGVGWVLSRAVPILGAGGEIVEWFGTGTDVTARHDAQQRLRQVEEQHRAELEHQVRERTTELHESRDLLQATMDASTDMIQVFVAIRNEEGEIIDFRWVLNNHTSESRYGKVNGESLLRRNPGVVVEGIFDAFKRVTETGRPEQDERHYVHEQFDGWFYQSVVKLGDGVATTTKDISDWKAAQQELLRLQAQVAQARIDESEERFRGLVQGMAQAVWDADADGVVVADSPSWRAYTGQTLEEWLGYGWLDAIHPDDRAFAERQWQAAVAAGRNVDAEFRLRQAGGGWSWTNVRAVPLKGSDGSIRRWSGINLDISERKAAEEALRRREEELRIITDNVPAMIGFYDREFRYRVVNEEFVRFFRKPKDEILGRTVAEVAGDQIFANLRPWMERALAGEQVRFEDEGWRAADPTLWGTTEENYVPHRNEAGEVDGFHALVFDITDRKRHERALRESEARFRLLVESVRDYAIFTIDRDGIITSWPAGAAAVYGWSEAEILGRSVELTFVPEDVANRQPQKELETAVREGVAPNVREHLRKDGTRIFINGSTQPLVDVDSQAREFIKIGQDVTGPRRMQQALADSEKRLRTLAEGMPQLVWRSGDMGHWTWSSPQWQAFTGQSLEASLGFGWLEVVHRDDREAAMAAWRQAGQTESISVEYRVRRASDGAYLWHHTRSAPVRNESGGIVEWLGTTTDVQQLKELQERQEILVVELQHRTRNLLGVVKSLLQETLKRSGSLASFKEQFGQRLDALARVNALLSRSGQPRITIGELVRTSLDALGGSTMGDRIRLDGPDVRLRSSIVQTLALALHELATNARKYGALAAEQGRLEVTWSTHQPDGEEPRLIVEWNEHGRAPIQVKAEPSRRGYGRELIERALPYALKARTHYELGEDGVRCSLDLPLTRPPRRERPSS